MATGRDYSSRQRKIIQRYYDHLDTITLTRLSELVSDLYLEEDPAKEARLWQRVKQALAKTPVEPDRVAGLLDRRDLKELANLITELSDPQASPGQTGRAGPGGAEGALSSAASPASPPAAASPSPTASTGAGSPSPAPTHEQQLKMAYNAFKKRMKLAKRDNVLAIEPPRDYPRAIWEELARQGRLKKDGNLYRLP